MIIRREVGFLNKRYMKKVLLTALVAFMVLPTMAQFEGFYRIRNNGAAKRYISIKNNKVEKRAKEVEIAAGASGEVSVWSLQTVKDPTTDPGSILYIAGNSSDLSLEGQGMRTRDLLSQYKLQNNGSALFSEVTKSGVSITAYMADNYEAEIGDNAEVRIIYGSKVTPAYGSYKAWEVIKIDNKEEFFAADPELKIGDKYYTTLYTSFAYELPEGVKAYYVDDHEYVNVVSPVSELKEITDIVPAATPVILECTSDKIEDNILKPIVGSDAPAAVKDNELKGIYFCGYLMLGGKERTKDWYLDEWKNVTAYDSETMRVLGKDAEGNLALIPATNNELVVTDLGKYLPANKAYFTISEKEAEATKNGIKLLNKTDFDTATAIQSVVSKTATEKSGIYTLTGARVAEGNSTEGLTKGIYIINGKKVVVR